jgi:rhodanese-related sulfurtransferase
MEEVQTLALPFLHDVRLLHIPTSDIPARISEIPKNQPVAVFCSAGTRSAIVYAYLRIMGLDRVRILVGGYPDVTEQATPGRLWKRLKAKGKTS